MAALSPTPSVNVRAGVGAVVRDGAGRVLLHRRRVGAGWAPVSGHVEAGETVRDALNREVAEETGLTLVDSCLVGVYSDPAYQMVDFPDGIRVHFVTCMFTAGVGGGRLRRTAEGGAWQWFRPDSLPHDLLPYAQVWLADTFAGHRHVLLR